MLASPYKEFKEALLDFIPKDRIHTDPLRLLAWPMAQMPAYTV